MSLHRGIFYRRLKLATTPEGSLSHMCHMTDPLNSVLTIEGHDIGVLRVQGLRFTPGGLLLCESK